MTKRAQKEISLPPPGGIDYHQTAQLSALQVLSLAFSKDSPACFAVDEHDCNSRCSLASSADFPSCFRDFTENFMEHVLQIFEADGAYLEILVPALSKRIRLALGSCRGGEGVDSVFFRGMKEPVIIRNPRRSLRATALEREGWSPKTSSLLLVPIGSKEKAEGRLVLGKSGVRSPFKQRDLEEIRLFVNQLVMVSRTVSTQGLPEEAVNTFSVGLEDGAYVIHRSGRPVSVNAKGMALLGVNGKEEAIRALYRDPAFLNARSKDDVPLSPDQLPLARALRGESFSSVETIIRRPGEMRDAYLSLSGGSLKNKKGEVEKGIVLARDITESKQLERRLRMDLFNREERERARKIFFSHVSHEIKTPLNVIVGYTSLLLAERYGELPEKAKEALSRTQVNAKEMSQMIGDLLSLSKMEAGKTAVSPEEVNLVALLGGVVEDVRLLLEEKPVAVSIKTDPGLPQIKSDRAKLKEILLDLLSNAAKYTSEGSIEIIAKDFPEQRRVRIDVVDTGIGIQEADLSHLFEEFYRVEDSATKTAAGTGLGLAIVKIMVELLQGSVEVKSVYGKGSTFTIFFPYALSPSP